jgi:lysophospholipase L1-like esterase
MADPTNITGLIDWWTSGSPGAPTRVYTDDGTTLVASSGDLVKRWTGVNGTLATQATSGSRMTWDNTVGAVIQGYGTNNQFDLPSGVSLNRRAFTAFFVMELHTLRDGNDGSNGNQIHHVIHKGAGGGVLNLYYDRAGVLTTYDGTTVRTSTSADLTTSRQLLMFIGDAAASYIYINGTLRTLGTLAAGTVTGTTFGSEPAGPNWVVNARVLDFGYFSVALGSTDRASMLTWAQNSRGVQSSYSANIIFDGDSLTAGAIINNNHNWPYKLLLPAAYRQVNIAEGGLQLTTMVSEAAAKADPWLLGGSNTDVVVCWGGTNDLAGGRTEANVRADYKTYTAARKSAGADKVIFLGTIPRPTSSNFTDGNLTSLTTDQRADFDAGSGTWNVDAFVDLNDDPTIGGSIANGNHLSSTYFQTDHIHLKEAGAAIVANLVYPFLSPFVGIDAASYSVSGPSSGNVGQASTNYTLALVGGCTFNGTQSVLVTVPSGCTATATAAGGTITNNGTTSVMVRPVAGATGFTFTMTPTTAGSKSISFTGYSGGTGTPVNRGWTNPANATYQANAPASSRSFSECGGSARAFTGF